MKNASSQAPPVTCLLDTLLKKSLPTSIATFGKPRRLSSTRQLQPSLQPGPPNTRTYAAVLHAPAPTHGHTPVRMPIPLYN